MRPWAISTLILPPLPQVWVKTLPALSEQLALVALLYLVSEADNPLQAYLVRGLIEALGSRWHPVSFSPAEATKESRGRQYFTR